MRRLVALPARLCLGIACVVCLVSCAGEQGEANETEPEVPAYDEVQIIQDGLDEMLHDLMRSSSEELSRRLGGYSTQSMASIDNYGVDPYVLLQHELGRCSYEVGDVRVQSEVASATVSLVGPDLSAVITEADEYLNSPEMIAEFAEAYEADDTQRIVQDVATALCQRLDGTTQSVTRQVSLGMTKRDGVWYLDDEGQTALAQALFGYSAGDA